MSHSDDLDQLIAGLSPVLDPYVYAYARLDHWQDAAELSPAALFFEDEGCSIIARIEHLEALGLEPVFECRRIVLEVYSSLDGVGLTAVVSSALADAGISANMVAALHHDHVFIPTLHADQALEILKRLSEARQV